MLENTNNVLLFHRNIFIFLNHQCIFLVKLYGILFYNVYNSYMHTFVLNITKTQIQMMIDNF